MELLNIKDLSINFGGLQAVKDVNFSIHKGEIVSLIGPNGAGKTTLFNMITGVNQPSSGYVQYQGKTITGLPSAAVANCGIIRTFQSTSLFPKVTVLENIIIARHRMLKAGLLSILFNTKAVQKEEKEAKEKALEILKLLKLEHRKDELAGSLPYGDQKVLAIGSALAAEPDLLLLDEPAAGLNPTETKELMALIKQIQGMGITIFLVEHDMGLVMGISDRVVVICNGAKIAEGLPSEIQKNEKVISAYLGSEDLDLVTK